MNKVVKCFMISGLVCDKTFENNVITVYMDEESQIAHIVNTKTDEVIVSIELNPSSGEGGGGTLSILDKRDA